MNTPEFSRSLKYKFPLLVTLPPRKIIEGLLFRDDPASAFVFATFPLADKSQTIRIKTRETPGKTSSTEFDFKTRGFRESNVDWQVIELSCSFACLNPGFLHERRRRTFKCLEFVHDDAFQKETNHRSSLNVCQKTENFLSI